MAYLDEVTGKVYDGNFVIISGKKTRIRTTYQILITINDRYSFEGFTNQETKKEALAFALGSVRWFYENHNKLIELDFNEDIFNIDIKFRIKKSKDQPYVEGDFKPVYL